MTTTSEYINQAQRVADGIGIGIEFTEQPGRCPQWGAKKEKRGCPRCGGIHGKCFIVKITRKATGASMEFDYWNSYASSFVTGADVFNDKSGKLRRELKLFENTIENGRVYERKAATPSVYDVLSCVSSDISMPIDPDEVAREFGEGMLPSQCTAVAQHARKLQAFFTPADQEKLAEVQ